MVEQHQDNNSREIKAVLADIDNCLAEPRKDISERVKTSFRRVGTEVPTGVITGRSRSSAMSFMNQLDTSGISVLSYGGQIYDARDVRNAVILEHPLNLDTISEITATLQESGIVWSAQDDTRNYSSKEFSEERPTKTFILTSKLKEPEVDDLMSILNNQTLFGDINVFKGHTSSSGNSRVFVTSAEATKLLGLLTVAEILDIEPEQILVFGDGYPDANFIGACTGIAVDNAVQEVRHNAVFIAPSVVDDGVAVGLDRYFPL